MQKAQYEHPINKISFITHDPEDKKIFGYVCSQPCSTGHKLFAIKSDKPVSRAFFVCEWLLIVNSEQHTEQFSTTVLHYWKFYIKRKWQCVIWISKHWEVSWKYDAQQCIFDEIWGVWIADQTLSQVHVWYIFSIKTKTMEQKER